MTINLAGPKTAFARVGKEFDFHAAHRLPNHDGQCRRLHGHSYRFTVEVIGPVNRVNGESDEGMVVDFSVLKQIYKTHIEPRVEHQFLNETLAEQVDVTTCEQIADWLASVFRDHLPTEITLLSLRLYETPTSYAEVR